MMNFSVYANTARFDNQARALTEDELFRFAPSIFAVEAHDSRSERFQPIPTIEILRGLQREGFQPVGARQSGTRDPSRREYTKHLIRLRRLDGREYSVGDTVFEIILKNANDGTAAYELIAGLFRVRCQNSLVAQIGTVDSVKVRHSGTAADVQGKVIDGTYSVLKTSELALSAPQDWGTKALNGEMKGALAEAVHIARFGDDDGNAARAITPMQFLRPRRIDDNANDLWTTWNVAQENAIKGGLRGVTRDERGNRRRTSTRAVNGIDQDIKLNRALWVLGERMNEILGGARVAA